MDTETITEAESFVSRKIADAYVSPDEFKRKLADLTQQQRHIHRSAADIVGAHLKLTVDYTALYAKVERDGELVTRLNQTLKLNDSTASRWRQIAAAALFLKQYQKVLPPALESLYEVTRALKKNEPAVRRAIDEKRLTPESTMREVRELCLSPKPVGVTTGQISDTAVNASALMMLDCRVRLPQTRVLRVDEVDALEREVAAALTAVNPGNVEVGISRGSQWQGRDVLEGCLNDYWAKHAEAERRELMEEVG